MFCKQLILGIFMLASGFVFAVDDVVLDFSKPLPASVIRASSGLSGSEHWGTWSDALQGNPVELVFVNALPKHFVLRLSVAPYVNNVDKDIVVSVGNRTQTFRLSNIGKQDIELVFQTEKNERDIHITVPQPTSPQSIYGEGNGDTRLLGIGFTALRITPAHVVLDFKQPLPHAVINRSSGLSGNEDWGTWSDALQGNPVELVFVNALPKHFVLRLSVAPYVNNVDKDIVVSVGNRTQTFRLSNIGKQDIELVFQTEKNEHGIRITVPQPTSPFDATNGASADHRLLGIGFHTLSIISPEALIKQEKAALQAIMQAGFSNPAHAKWFYYFGSPHTHDAQVPEITRKISRLFALQHPHAVLKLFDQVKHELLAVAENMPAPATGFLLSGVTSYRGVVEARIQAAHPNIPQTQELLRMELWLADAAAVELQEQQVANIEREKGALQKKLAALNTRKSQAEQTYTKKLSAAQSEGDKSRITSNWLQYDLPQLEAKIAEAEASIAKLQVQPAQEDKQAQEGLIHTIYSQADSPSAVYNALILSILGTMKCENIH